MASPYGCFTPTTSPRHVRVDVEIWLSVFGPRGIELANGDRRRNHLGMPMEHALPIAMLMPGTVLQPGEDA